MKIKELQPRQTNVEVEGVITQIAEPREFEKFGKKGKVANATLKDESGEVKLSLWNEQIDQVKIGDIVKIQKGYVGEWKGELQLTTGKFGVIEVINKPTESEVTSDELEEAELDEAEPSAEESVTEDNLEESGPGDLDVEEEDVR